jgi:hypothetical protein
VGGRGSSNRTKTGAVGAAAVERATFGCARPGIRAATIAMRAAVVMSVVVNDIERLLDPRRTRPPAILSSTPGGV